MFVCVCVRVYVCIHRCVYYVMSVCDSEVTVAICWRLKMKYVCMYVLVHQSGSRSSSQAFTLRCAPVTFNIMWSLLEIQLIGSNT